MRVYGGHKVSVKWDESMVTGTILANSDTTLILRCFGKEEAVQVKKGEQIPFAFERKN